MLKKINLKDGPLPAQVNIAKAQFPAPFSAGLEFNAPARGPWNIVHTGMLLPQSHQIFACAQGCLRGVILTAAEMNAIDRMSWISVCENDMFNGKMEQNIIDGASDILNKMSQKPPAVLLFISCIHQFAGCDFNMIINELRGRFPDIGFVDCYMNPTMRKSGLTPDENMRRQLYGLLEPTDKDEKQINIIGNDRPTDESSELIKMLRAAGFKICDITLCKTYKEYLEMAKSAVNITYLPAAKASGIELERRLSQKNLYLPLSYRFKEIDENYKLLCDTLGFDIPDLTAFAEQADTALKNARRIIGNMPVEIDYTSTPRPLGLARLLLEYGFFVRKVYADGFVQEDKVDFEWLQKNAPNLNICATVNPKMRFVEHATHSEKVLAIGQKAAYFSGTGNFVNVVAGGGMYGFDGIARLAGLMVDAFEHEKDTRTLIQYKGLGCESCL